MDGWMFDATCSHTLDAQRGRRMTGSAVPVLNVWTQKKISIKGEGSGERGTQIGPG